MIAGCFGAGFPLSLSAALVSAFLQENPNHPPARFCLIVDLAPYRHGPTSGLGWFHLYVMARINLSRGENSLTASLDADATLIVADRHFVLSGRKGRPRLGRMVGEGVDPHGPEALGKMFDLERGKSPEFVSLAEELGWPLPSEADLDAGKVFHPKLVAAEIEFQTAVKNAVGLVSVNLSLSIRRAFDRFYELRKANGGPLWSEAVQ